MQIVIPQNRPLDAICLGRAGVDLYAREANTRFSEVSGFEKYVGGSPANIAAAIAKLGGKPGFIGCVSDDGLGRYVCEYLTEIGADLQGMQRDNSGTRTSMAVTEMFPADPEVVIYRNQAADLALKPDQICPEYIASARMLVVSGTALSASPSREATLVAIDHARRQGTLVVLDIDYRAYSWDSPEASAIYYQLAAQMADILIGNREEFDVLEYLCDRGNQDDDKTAERFLQQATQLVIIKAGEQGCKVYGRDGLCFEQGIFPVEVKKPFGAGDSFAGALIYGLINGYRLNSAVAMGSAMAAINVAGDSCTEAMASLPELLEFMQARGCVPQLSAEER